MPTTYPASPRAPRVRQGGFVLIDTQTDAVERVIPFQYNPESLSRSVQARGAGEGGDRAEALRLTGPPVETISIEAELDATDQLEFPTENPTAVEVGLHAQLAALENVLYPTAASVRDTHDRAMRGELEIIPRKAPLVLFVWGQSRVVPVLISDLSAVEEGFDPELNPLRVRLSMNMTVMTTNDVAYSSRAAAIYRAYHRTRERLAQQQPQGALNELGLEELP